MTVVVFVGLLAALLATYGYACGWWQYVRLRRAGGRQEQRVAVVDHSAIELLAPHQQAAMRALWDRYLGTWGMSADELSDGIDAILASEPGTGATHEVMTRRGIVVIEVPLFGRPDMDTILQ